MSPAGPLRGIIPAPGKRARGGRTAPRGRATPRRCQRIINISGRGDKDMGTIAKHFGAGVSS